MRVNAQTKDEHRRALLGSAAGAFAGEGYEGAAIDRISQAAGLAKGTIYNTSRPSARSSKRSSAKGAGTQAKPPRRSPMARRAASDSKLS